MCDRHVVIFDGECNFCHGAVNFIIKRDPQAIFVFAAMQSNVADQIMEKYNIDSVSMDTILLIKKGQCYVFSSAAFEIVKDLTWPWPVLSILKFIPLFLRDYLYRLFARHRYVLFGRRELCLLPSDDVKSRFLGT
jgi:predicted DCC family thiol-disulfide oxidoreductase YuxK|tara:strand:- start:16388 stop:16792 length:405 start_codon:yes stop_codon:yes gene_type:complete